MEQRAQGHKQHRDDRAKTCDDYRAYHLSAFRSHNYECAKRDDPSTVSAFERSVNARLARS